jgi:hypothetical protein
LNGLKQTARIRRIDLQLILDLEHDGRHALAVGIGAPVM